MNTPTVQQTLILLHTILDAAERIAPVFGPNGVLASQVLGAGDRIVEAVQERYDVIRGDAALLAEVAAAGSENVLDGLGERLAKVEGRRIALLAER